MPSNRCRPDPDAEVVREAERGSDERPLIDSGVDAANTMSFNLTTAKRSLAKE